MPQSWQKPQLFVNFMVCTNWLTGGQTPLLLTEAWLRMTSIHHTRIRIPLWTKIWQEGFKTMTDPSDSVTYSSSTNRVLSSSLVIGLSFLRLDGYSVFFLMGDGAWPSVPAGRVRLAGERSKDVFERGLKYKTHCQRSSFPKSNTSLNRHDPVPEYLGIESLDSSFLTKSPLWPGRGTKPTS